MQTRVLRKYQLITETFPTGIVLVFIQQLLVAEIGEIEWMKSALGFRQSTNDKTIFNLNTQH